MVEMEYEWCDIPGGKVTIAGGSYRVGTFRISKYPVTHAQFQQFVDAADGFHNPIWWAGLAKRETFPAQPQWAVADHPREMVSWYDAVAFCRWLSEKLGYDVRLPTEQEWQRAAQGDDEREFPWGSTPDPARANTAENRVVGTTPVDAYPQGASPYGVMDMAGNVWEWCLNEFEDPDNIRLEGNVFRVARGGSWSTYQNDARTTTRHRSAPGNRLNDHGFRLVAGRLPGR